jgi:hypothetical protein
VKFDIDERTEEGDVPDMSKIPVWSQIPNQGDRDRRKNVQSDRVTVVF